MALISAQLGVACQIGVKDKLGQLPREVTLSRVSLADDMFSLWVSGSLYVWFKETAMDINIPVIVVIIMMKSDVYGNKKE